MLTAFLFVLLFFLFIVLLIASTVLQSRSFIGKSGENFIAHKLQRLDQSKYKVLNNIVLSSNGNTDTTQIDHIVVSVYGIFCIETKMHKGWIFGSVHKKYWTQVLYKKKYRLYNPLRQNYAHIKSLEFLLGEKIKSPIISLVAFPRASRLKIDDLKLISNGQGTIANLLKYQDVIYDQTEIQTIYEVIKNSSIKDKEIDAEHIRQIRNITNLSSNNN